VLLPHQPLGLGAALRAGNGGAGAAGGPAPHGTARMWRCSACAASEGFAPMNAEQSHRFALTDVVLDARTLQAHLLTGEGGGSPHTWGSLRGHVRCGDPAHRRPHRATAGPPSNVAFDPRLQGRRDALTW
jgi:hypothetical protein